MKPGLDRIVWRKKIDLARRKSNWPVSKLRAMAGRAGSVRPFERALRTENGIALIAELKKASPSAGLLRPLYDVSRFARAYERGGASALSILTEEYFFRGDLAHLNRAKKAAGLPVLRKDFIFDPYQVVESRAWGADAVLLIVALLPEWELRRMISLVRQFGMTPLVEVHDASELDTALAVKAKVIGINSRNLKDLSMDPALFGKLVPRIPGGRTVVAESGVKTAEEVTRLSRQGASAVLVGESLLRQPDLESAVRKILGKEK